jgi:hypothetical protein
MAKPKANPLNDGRFPARDWPYFTKPSSPRKMRYRYYIKSAPPVLQTMKFFYYRTFFSLAIELQKGRINNVMGKNSSRYVI